MKRNILVFPCGSETGLAIYHQLRYSRFFHLIGGSSFDDHGKFVYEDYIGTIPTINDPALIPYLRKIVECRDIEAIYPSMDAVIALLKSHERELGCKVISSSADTTLMCLDKKKTYDRLIHTDIIPKIFTTDKINAIDSYPVFVKPRVGYGSKGTKLIANNNDLITHLKENCDVVISEYLPGNEYTVDCFTDRHGKLRFAAGRLRKRIRNGISVNTTYTKNQEPFKSIAVMLNSLIEFRGAWFCQLKEDINGKLKLLEIASRFGGSSLLSFSIGVNLPLLSVFDALDMDVDICANLYDTELDRALENKYKIDITFDNVYVDFDDCLLLDNSTVNTLLVQFLYKCVNEKKRIILLSKHDGDLILELEKYRLNRLFDEIIHIQTDENKVDYINPYNSIFIDDSHAERKAVSKRYKIPVFSPEMVEILI